MPYTAEPMKTEPYDFVRIRRDLVAEFGKEAIRRLHRQTPALDWLMVVGIWVLFGSLVYLLGTLTPLRAPWLVCFVVRNEPHRALWST